jgi:hypothetical protein
LKLSTCSTTAASVRMGACSVLLFLYSTIISFCLDHVEGEVVVLSPHGQVSDLLPIRCLVIVANHAYRCCVIGKLNDGVGVILAVQS